MAKREGTPLEEALRLSSRKGAAMQEAEFDPDVADLNNPDVETLAEPPLLGARPKSAEMYGEHAETFGRASSPKLYAAAAQFPTATQFRVWRWENGIPVGLGAIDAEATEDDFVRQFFDAMPQTGEGRFQFRLRPIDIRGAELGKEFTINISEHHGTLKAIRARKKAEKEESPMWNRMGPGGAGDIIVNTPNEGSTGATYAEEMGRMFEQAVEAAEMRTKTLQETLEQERDRLRTEEARRVEERVSLAERSATVVQQMTEKLMSTDRLRSEEAMKAQREQSGFMLNTLTSVFAQQQEAARTQSDRMREMDTLRMQQDREFFERQRQEMEMQRQRERDESERRRISEREEYERKRRAESEEWERRRTEERERLALEQRRWEETRKYEAEQLRLEAQRREQDLENRRRNEQMEFERKMALEKEERERRERNDRERWEREARDAERKREEERREWERRETLRREELGREADRRREEMQIQMKQMEMTAQRDREHAERMMEMARLEREAQREAQLNREKVEREAREAQDRDRQRAHEMAIKEMEMAKERDREHQERMLQLSKMQTAGGLGAITEMLGMDTGEILSKIFGGGGGGEGGGSWTDAIPKVLGAVADMGKVALQAQAAAAQSQQRAPRRDVGTLPGAAEQQVAIQTPQGVRLIPASALAGLQASMAAQQQNRVALPARPITEDEAQFSAAESVNEAFAEGPDEAEEEEQEAKPEEKTEEKKVDPDYVAGSQVNYMKRARDGGLKLPQQRNARKAIRDLGARLAEAPEADWTGIVTEAITATPDIYFYIEAVSIWAALAEAKIEPDLSGRIVKALKDSGAIPDSVPYNEEDFKRIRAEKEAK